MSGTFLALFGGGFQTESDVGAKRLRLTYRLTYWETIAWVGIAFSMIKNRKNYKGDMEL